MAEKRIRTSTAHNDIENALISWQAYANGIGNREYGEKVDSARIRVTTWLEQVDADQAQHHKAMLACQAMVAAAEIRDDDSQAERLETAVKLAREAIEG